MQAIITKYVGPTDTKPGRIIAKCAAARHVHNWDYALSVDQNHDAAAKALAEKLEWFGEWNRGGMPDSSGNAYVCVARGGYEVETTRVARI